MWEVIAATGGPSANFDFVMVRNFPSPVPVPDAVDLVRRFFLRHPVVRASISGSSNGWLPLQHIPADGGIQIPVLTWDRSELDGLRDLVPATTPGQPCRPLLLLNRGLVWCLAMRVSHLVIDAAGLALLNQDLADTPVGEAPSVGPAETPSPIELASFEESEKGLRVQRRATDFAADVYAVAPATMWPRRRRAPERQRFWFGELRSGPLLAAISALAGEKRLSRGGILAGALATVTASSSGLRSALMFMISSNRFDPLWLTYPGTLAQEAILHVPIGETMMETMRIATVQTLRSLSAARYSPAAMAATRRAAEDRRGVSFDKLGSAVVLNVLADAPARYTPSSAPSPKTFSWTGSTDLENLALYVDAYQQDQEFVLNVRVDTALLSPQETEALVGEIESAVVSTAASGGRLSG